MSDQTNAEYFAGRAAIERGLSESAADARAAAIHADLAARYEELARQFNAPAEGPRLHLAPALQIAAGQLEPESADARDQRG